MRSDAVGYAFTRVGRRYGELRVGRFRPERVEALLTSIWFHVLPVQLRCSRPPGDNPPLGSRTTITASRDFSSRRLRAVSMSRPCRWADFSSRTWRSDSAVRWRCAWRARVIPDNNCGNQQSLNAEKDACRKGHIRNNLAASKSRQRGDDSGREAGIGCSDCNNGVERPEGGNSGSRDRRRLRAAPATTDASANA